MVHLPVLSNLFRRFARRRAGVVVIFALASPMLIGATGLAMDISYWYQDQENLQTAADAAAVAAANAEATYTTNVTTAAQAQPFALQAANVATNGQYNFGGGVATVSVTPSQVSGNTKWTASAAAPRLSFFSAVQGMGVSGLAHGTQGAVAAAVYMPVTPSNCLITKGQVITYNNAKIQGQLCSLYTSYSGSCPYNVSSGGVIEGKSLGIVTGNTENQNSGCASGASNAYVGPTGSYVITNPTTITGVAATPAPSELVTLGGTPPNGANVMAAAVAGLAVPTGLCTGTANIANNQPGTLLVGCSYGTQAYQYNPSSLAIGTNANGTLATTGTTLVTGGVASQSAMGPVTMGGSEIYLEKTSYPAGAFYVQLAAKNQSISTQGGTGFQMEVNGATNIGTCGSGCTGDSLNLGLGTYYFDSGSATNTAFDGMQTMSVSAAAGSTIYFYGTVNTQQGGTWTFNKGTYVFDGAVSITNGTVDFEGGTYYFENGLDESIATNNVTFGPGIYYILGGTLDLKANNLIATGATFIFENGANYEISNQTAGGSMTMSAPNTTDNPNCVPAASFPLASYTNFPPYDGTNGNGICNVLFYQMPSDTAADGIQANNVTYMNGIIYQPGGTLTMSYNTGGNAAPGNSTLEASTGGGANNFLEIESGTFSNSATDVILSSQSGGSFNAGSAGVLSFLVQ